jgi:hypothetical protein
MTTRRVLVITTYDPKPIPTRNHDWSAYLDNYEPNEPLGHGPSEADAVYDLYAQIADREDATEEESQ